MTTASCGGAGRHGMNSRPHQRGGEDVWRAEWGVGMTGVDVSGLRSVPDCPSCDSCDVSCIMRVKSVTFSKLVIDRITPQQRASPHARALY